MQSHWAIDLGTTNTLIARWMGTHAETIALESICDHEPAWGTPLVPSAVFFETADSGRIGREALTLEEVMRATYAGRLTPLARAFKRVLARNSQQAVAEVDLQQVSARACAVVFLRGIIDLTNQRERDLAGRAIPSWNVYRRLLAWVRREGLVNDLTMTAPVESFEPYRMELQNIARKLGVQHFRTLDEPVAAALGYGVDLTDDRNLLVADFGGGTLDLALVRTNLGNAAAPARRDVGHRKAELVAARGMVLGGETVDEWVAQMACAKLKAHSDAMYPYIRSQAEAVKKELSGKVLTTDETYFRLPGSDTLTVSRHEFLEALEARGLYTTVERVAQAVLEDAAHKLSIADIDAVLLVGGSNLLPGIRELYERIFGAQRVHYWEPFEAVVKGAAIYGAGYSVDQIVHHDYAIRVYNDQKLAEEFELLIKRNTPYPTPRGFQTRYYAVAPGQSYFSLPLCEIGLAGRVSLGWQRRSNGNDYWAPGSEAEKNECIAILNEGDQLRLAPPGRGPQARLRVDFTIDQDRFLCASIHDLLREREIVTDQRVFRLR